VGYFPLFIDDMQITRFPNDAYDNVTLPVLWVSHREPPAWFPDEDTRKDSTNAYSCEHYTQGQLKAGPVDYGSFRGLYYDGCDTQSQFRENNCLDVIRAGFAYIYAWVYLFGDEADIGVQSEADLIFINSHYTDGLNETTQHLYYPDLRGFQPFKNSAQGYPGDCTSTINYTSMLSFYSDDCKWLATTGCESLLELTSGPYYGYTGPWPPIGYMEPLQEAAILTNINLNSIAGFKLLCKPEHVYPVVEMYEQRLNSCDGSYDPDLWLSPPATSDCNIIAWMEAFCLARRTRSDDFQKGIEAAMYARAIDSIYKYDIDWESKEIKFLGIKIGTVRNWFIIYSYIYP